jgi:hypothetical protein
MLPKSIHSHCWGVDENVSMLIAVNYCIKNKEPEVNHNGSILSGGVQKSATSALLLKHDYPAR